jgi:pectin methylesterase-like acyl-CoA thioesterase
MPVVALVALVWACSDGAPPAHGSAAGGNAGDASSSMGGTTDVSGGAGSSALGGSGLGGTSGMAAAGAPVTAGGSGEGTAGQAGSGGAPEPVDLPEGVTGLFPIPGTLDVCSDPALRLTFATPPALGQSGKLHVFDSAQPTEPIAVVDFATDTVKKTIGGQSFNLPRPVFLDGESVVVPLDSRTLAYGKQYFVTLEEGAISAGGASFSITDSEAWRFSTRDAAPSGSSLRVALDGSGQFCSWQGALDAVPAGNSAPVTIDIGKGTYHGIVYFEGKQNVTLRGEDRKKTVLSGVNNNNLNAGTRVRALFGADSASGLVIENLTIHNLTPQGGSQAEALRLQKCDQCVVRNADISSLQDTLLWSGRLYAEDCFIAGNVDFIWGDGAAYFNRCEIKTVGRSGVIVQSRNGAGQHGYVFVDSKITSDPGITGSTLARIDVSQYPNSHVAYVDCTLGSHISKAAWSISGGSAPGSLRFWEYRSKNEAGALLDVGDRVAGVQITAEQAAQMRDPKVVLGGWQPP